MLTFHPKQQVLWKSGNQVCQAFGVIRSSLAGTNGDLELLVGSISGRLGRQSWAARSIQIFLARCWGGAGGQSVWRGRQDSIQRVVEVGGQYAVL